MKSLSLLVIFSALFSIQVIQAQSESKNSFFVGGYAYFHRTKINQPTTIGANPPFSYFTYELNPLAGLSFNERWGAGIVMLFGTTKDEIFNTPTKTRQKGGGIFTTYTFNPQNKLRIFLQPQLTVGFIKTEYTSFIQKESINTFVLDIKTALSARYQFDDHWAMILNLGDVGFATVKNKQTTAPPEVTNFFYANLNFSFTSFNWSLWYYF